MNWWDYGVSQYYGQHGETGIDIATPFHTAITAPYGGVVKNVSVQPWGAEVGILANIPGVGTVLEYIFHLDTTAVQVGQSIAAGTFLGLSGGENPGYPGAINPAQPQYSTGPHVEFNLMNPSNTNQHFNPTAYVTDAALAGVSGTTSGTTGTVPLGYTTSNGTVPLGYTTSNGSPAFWDVGGNIAQGIAHGVQDVFNNAFIALGFANAMDAAQRIGAGVGAVIIMDIGALIIIGALVIPAAEKALPAVADVATDGATGAIGAVSSTSAKAVKKIQQAGSAGKKKP